MSGLESDQLYLCCTQFKFYLLYQREKFLTCNICMHRGRMLSVGSAYRYSMHPPWFPAAKKAREHQAGGAGNTATSEMGAVASPSIPG